VISEENLPLLSFFKHYTRGEIRRKNISPLGKEGD